MTTAATALTLQRLLEGEGAFIHAAVQARELPGMGGGVGVILSTPLPAGTTLARFPFCSMITAHKARFNLAMAEVALGLRDEALSTVPFASYVWSTHDFESRVRSQKIRRAIEEKVEELKEALDSTETILCYILLMAALYDRWGVVTPQNGRGSSSHTPNDKKAPVLHYTHENKWMRTWIHALPVQYDNLLELAPVTSSSSGSTTVPIMGFSASSSSVGGTTPGFSAASAVPVPPLPLTPTYTTTSPWLRSYVSLHRFRSTALREQQAIEQRYARCCAALHCLRSMPGGVEEADSADAAAMTPVEAPATSCTLGQFVWAFNTLMSRGFFYPVETWALMPFVDYFNYALEANGTMYPQEDDPEEATCLTNRTLAKLRDGGDAPLTSKEAVAPRKQPRRTGLRTARVGGGELPLANYNTYEFLLVRPLRDAGEQVMLHYGAYSDMELLTWYGFTLRPFLLPLHSLLGKEATRTTEEAAVIPLLPPKIKSADLGEALADTARAMQRTLPLLVHSSTRFIFYRDHICPLQFNATPDLNNEEDGREDYNNWQSALHRAYRLPLSPLADAEGNYPAVRRGTSWIETLFEAFLKTPAVPSASAAAITAAVGYDVDAWMRLWVSERWPLFVSGAVPAIARDAGLGVLGLSPTLHTAIRSSFWTAPSTAVMDAVEQARMVRGLSWAELYVNLCLLLEDGDGDGDGDTCDGEATPLSAAVAAYARFASVDQWALLRFLALEATEELLQEYVEFDEENSESRGLV